MPGITSKKSSTARSTSTSSRPSATRTSRPSTRCSRCSRATRRAPSSRTRSASWRRPMNRFFEVSERAWKEGEEEDRSIFVFVARPPEMSRTECSRCLVRDHWPALLAGASDLRFAIVRDAFPMAGRPLPFDGGMQLSVDSGVDVRGFAEGALGEGLSRRRGSDAAIRDAGSAGLRRRAVGGPVRSSAGSGAGVGVGAGSGARVRRRSGRAAPRAGSGRRPWAARRAACARARSRRSRRRGAGSAGDCRSGRRSARSRPAATRSRGQPPSA